MTESAKLGLDLSRSTVTLHLNAEELEQKTLPRDFGLDVLYSKFPDSDKTVMFSNNGSGLSFFGYIDCLLIHNGCLTDREVGELHAQLNVENKAIESTGDPGTSAADAVFKTERAHRALRRIDTVTNAAPTYETTARGLSYAERMQKRREDEDLRVRELAGLMFPQLEPVQLEKILQNDQLDSDQ